MIANGLRTYVEANYGRGTKIILVGHSLGGVIARQYILDEIKNHRVSTISGVVLFATPHTGAALAKLGTFISSAHEHLRQLCKGSDILEIINSDWVTLKVETHVKALYIVGGCDAVVERESAAPYFGADNIRTIIDHDHTGVIKPTDSDDIRFKILKNFILCCLPLKLESAILGSCEHQKESDVLFDIYSHVSEHFYIRRDIDATLHRATRNSHAWVSGISGCGKTASLMRLIEMSDWKIQQVTLGSYSNLNAQSLMREVCNILCERAGIELNGVPIDADSNSLHTYFRRAFIKLCNAGPMAVLIEEIPLASSEEYANFLDITSHLIQSIESIGVNQRIIWLFSSITDPYPHVPRGSVKLLERVQFLKCDSWDDTDMTKLIDMISKEFDTSISSDNHALVLAKAKGSPRFVKILFRRSRNEVAATKPLAELIASVEMDLS